MSVDHGLVNQLAERGYLSAEDIATTQNLSPGYVRKRACLERWERIRAGGRTYYRMPAG